MRIIDKKIWPDMFENDKELPVDFRLAAKHETPIRYWTQKQLKNMAYISWNGKKKMRGNNAVILR